MKQFFVLLFCLIPFMANGQSQSKSSIVKLKNGTELKGIIKSIDPMNAMVLFVGGVETTIQMTDVLRVEEDTQPSASETDENKTSNSISDDLLNQKLVVTDFADYPESIYFQIGPELIKMILVRGGDMNMGYDGKGSLSMNSEPLHKVTVTSFYLSETFVTSKVYQEVTNKNSINNFYIAVTWSKADGLVKEIAKKVGLPVRLPTEVEWEYAAFSPVQNILFSVCKDFEYCLDLYKKYQPGYAIDPTGSVKGSNYNHVRRAFDRPDGKLDRSPESGGACFRLAIKAKDIIIK